MYFYSKLILHILVRIRRQNKTLQLLSVEIGVIPHLLYYY